MGFENEIESDKLAQAKTVIAAFDFDGTMTRRDTLISFLFFAAGKRQAAKKLAWLAPQFIKYVCQLASRQEVKEAILASFFKGMPMAQLQEIGEAFSQSDALARLIQPGALKRLEWHLGQKHRCVLVSASIDTYLVPWCRAKGFHDLICSQLEADDNCNATGRLKGLNCWGPEKSRRLAALTTPPRKEYVLYAYGDSRGDRELLAMADFSYYGKIS